MNSLESIPSYWWLMALAGLAIMIGLGVGFWRTKSIKLLRAIRLENRGMRILWAGYHENAEALLSRALRLAEDAVGPEGADVGPILANLAQVYWFQKNRSEAEHLYLRAIAIRENAIGPEDPFLVPVLNNLAKLYRDQDRDADAAPLEARANAILEATPDEKIESSWTRGIFTRSGLIPQPPGWEEHMEAAFAAEDVDKAEEHLREAVAVAGLPGSDDPYLGESLHELGVALLSAK